MANGLGRPSQARMFEGDGATIYNSFTAGDKPVHEQLCSLVEQQYEASGGGDQG